MCVEAERTSKVPSYTLLHHLPPAISHILGSFLNSLCFISPHFVTDPADIVNLKYDILSTIYSQGQRLALKEGACILRVFSQLSSFKLITVKERM